MVAYANPSFPSPSQIGAPLPQDLRDYYLQFGDQGAGFWNFLGQGRTSQGREGRDLYGQGGGQYDLAGNDPLSRFTQNQFGRYQGMYASAVADQPGLGFVDFLRRQRPEQDYAMQTPTQQGFFSNVITPRARMVLR